MQGSLDWRGEVGQDSMAQDVVRMTVLLPFSREVLQIQHGVPLRMILKTRSVSLGQIFKIPCYRIASTLELSSF